MPIIEIISLQAESIHINSEEFRVAVEIERNTFSQRGLFASILELREGIVLHVGNPACKLNGDDFFYAANLINWEFEPSEDEIPMVDVSESISNWMGNATHQYQFRSEYLQEIDHLLRIALKASQMSCIFFLSDYQFGPKQEQVRIIYTIKEFWALHDSEGLTFNTLYEIYGA